VLLEVSETDDQVALPSPATGVDVRWLLNSDADDIAFLARAVAELEWPEGAQFFVHGERESIKATRTILRERGVPRESLSISAYWARGRTEDAFQAEKQEPVGKIE
jgi:NADPH-dependent ferric siderophore reductase